MRKRNPGDIYAISLPDGTFAFGRAMHRASMQFFRFTSRAANIPASALNDVLFTVSVHKRFYADPRVQCVTTVPFVNDSEAWPPNGYTYDPIGKKYSLYNYQLGTRTPSTRQACADLEPVAVWDVQHIIDRLTGETDWLQAIKMQEPS